MMALNGRALLYGAAVTWMMMTPLGPAIADSVPPPPPSYPYRTLPPDPPLYPVPVVVRPAPPPPLSPAMRVLYAPFYGAGLVLRYGLYYLIVAPIEVFARAVSFGVEGGVEAPEERR
jgi:hypothetical protein